MTNKNDIQTKYKAKKKKKLDKSGEKKNMFFGWSLVVLFQAHPLAQESEEGIPIDKAKQQGARASSKAMKQQYGGGEEVPKNGERQGRMARQWQ